MASQAIVKGRKYVLKHLSLPVRSCSSFSSLGRGRYAPDTDTRVPTWISEQSCSEVESSGQKKHVAVTTKEDLIFFCAQGSFRRPSSGIYNSGFGYGSQEFVLPFAVRGLAQSVATASTDIAGRPEKHNEEEPRKDQGQKEFKEASPEECDQAVEGLSTAKAKAKAKQMQDSQKSAQSFIHKFWAKLLGIGPALRAVASMSRY